MVSHLSQFESFILSLASLAAFVQIKSLRTKHIQQWPFISGIFDSGPIHWVMCSLIFRSAELPGLQLIPGRIASAQHFWRSHPNQWVAEQPQPSLDVFCKSIRHLQGVGAERKHKQRGLHGIYPGSCTNFCWDTHERWWEEGKPGN